MKKETVWHFLDRALSAQQSCILLVVTEHAGSSPGKQGFKMAVDAAGNIAGSIGGGNIEYMLIEQAKKMLHTGATKPLLCKKIHHATQSPAQCSGMICSGEQSVVLCPIFDTHQPIINACMTDNCAFCITPVGISVAPEGTKAISFQHPSDGQWSYQEHLAAKNTIYIFGGGHVGLALSRIMAALDFYIVILDDRPHIHTLKHNHDAHEKHTIHYAESGQYVSEGEHAYAVIMTHSHTADDVVLTELAPKQLKYLGMMASRAKKIQVFNHLKNQGIPAPLLEKVHCPIGIPIHSHTPEEIAISIAAEIIRVKNG